MEEIKKSLFMTQELESKDGFTWTLASKFGDALHLAEKLYGERDKSYTILGFEFEKSGPRIWYPGNRKFVVIQLSLNALYNEFQAFYQMAHETIHLLSPLGFRGANILEEGLATYFARLYLLDLGQDLNPNDQKYQNALELTKVLLDIDNDIIKKVRKIEPTISKLTPSHFYQINSNISEDLLTSLCNKFHQNN
jgi:hypothetical protein